MSKDSGGVNKHILIDNFIVYEETLLRRSGGSETENVAWTKIEG